MKKANYIEKGSYVPTIAVLQKCTYSTSLITFPPILVFHWRIQSFLGGFHVILTGNSNINQVKQGAIEVRYFITKCTNSPIPYKKRYINILSAL